MWLRICVYGFCRWYKGEWRDDFVSLYLIYWKNIIRKRFIEFNWSSYWKSDSRGSQFGNRQIVKLNQSCVVFTCICTFYMYCIVITNDTNNQSKSFFHFLSIKIIDFGFMHSLNRHLYKSMWYIRKTADVERKNENILQKLLFFLSHK